MDIWKSYKRGHPVLKGINLKIEGGKVVALMGPNGAGKSTLLRIISGLEKPDRGSLKLFGRDANTDEGVFQKIAYMPETECLVPYLSGIENIKFYSRISGKGEELVRKAVETANLFGLNALKKLVKDYSSGMKRLLSLSIITSIGREMYVLDEPTKGLDPLNRTKVLELLHQMKPSSTLFSTHIGADAERADLVAFMHGGQLIDCNEPKTLIEKYAGDYTVLRVKAKMLEGRKSLSQLPQGFVVEEEAGGFRIVVKKDEVSTVEKKVLSTLSGAEVLGVERPSIEDAYRIAVRGERH